MARFDYTQAKSNANAIIAEFGAAGSFTRTIQGTIDPATGEESAGSTSLLDGIVTPILRYGHNEVNGESVQRGDGYVYFDGAEVWINDTTIINGEKWRCIDAERMTSVDGVRVYQKLQLRR